MARTLSRNALKQYILQKLGAPVIDINIADIQLDEAINDSLAFFQEYHYEGTERVFIARKVTQADIDNKFIPTPEGVASVVRVFKPHDTAFGASVSESLFDIQYHFYKNEIFELTRSGAQLSNFFITMQYISQMNDTLNFDLAYRFHSSIDRLYIDTNWNTRFRVDQYIVYEAYKIVDPEQFNQLYDNWVLKALCVAEAKKQWGQNLIKFNGVPLPGGLTLNGTEMYQNALTEIDQIRTDFIMKFSEPLDFFIG